MLRAVKEGEGPEEGVYEGWARQRGHLRQREWPRGREVHSSYKNSNEDSWEPRRGPALVARLRNWGSSLYSKGHRKGFKQGVLRSSELYSRTISEPGCPTCAVKEGTPLLPPSPMCPQTCHSS